jgi:hypothetical protein
MRTMLPNSALGHLTGATVGAVVVGLITGALTGVRTGTLAGIAGAATVFVVAGWLTLWPLDAEGTRRKREREDLRPGLCDLAGIPIPITTTLPLDHWARRGEVAPGGGPPPSRAR